MASFNLVVLVGNLTRDPELKHLPSGTAVCEIGLAVNDRVKKGNEWMDETCFVDVTYFGRTAEVCSEYLAKGANILVEGRLKFEQWESQGQKRSKLKVIGDKMQMFGGKKEGGGQSRGESRQTQQTSYAPPADGGGGDDSIPF